MPSITPVLRRCLAASLLLGVAHARGADWTAYATLSSDYIYRGVSLVETGPSLQVGFEGDFDRVLVAGAWAAQIDRGWTYGPEATDRIELDAYAGLDFACGSKCRMRLLASRYLFPGTELREWNEGSASIELYDRVGASLAWSPHGLGTDWISRTVEGWVQQPLTRNSSVELGYGSVALARFDYWFARVGLTHRLDRFVLGLTYHWSDPELRRFGFDEKSRRLVLSISTAY